MLREHLTHTFIPTFILVKLGSTQVLEQDSPGSVAEVEPAQSQLLSRSTSLPANLEVLSEVTASVSSGLWLWDI